MALNIIDISSWQSDLDISKLPSSLDGGIVKATQGESYTSPTFYAQIEVLRERDCLIGAYHYIDGSGYKAEMDHFIEIVSDYIGDAILALDWEETQNARWGSGEYLSNCVKYLIERTGVKPLIYASKSVYPDAIAEANDCGKWIAQYASTAKVNGFQSAPWNEDAYSCAIRQYTSNGRLNGYDGALDLDKAYMTREAWGKYAKADIKTTDEDVSISSGSTLTFTGDVTITVK